MPVDTTRTVQPYGLLHGGASVGAPPENPWAAWVLPCAWDADEYQVVGQEINANHVGARRAAGLVTRKRRERCIWGGRTHVWSIEIVNDRTQKIGVHLAHHHGGHQARRPQPRKNFTAGQIYAGICNVKRRIFLRHETKKPSRRNSAPGLQPVGIGYGRGTGCRAISSLRHRIRRPASNPPPATAPGADPATRLPRPDQISPRPFGLVFSARHKCTTPASPTKVVPEGRFGRHQGRSSGQAALCGRSATNTGVSLRTISGRCGRLEIKPRRRIFWRANGRRKKAVVHDPRRGLQYKNHRRRRIRRAPAIFFHRPR